MCNVIFRIEMKSKLSSKYGRLGFTMLELMVTMVIIVILSAIAIASYNSYTLNSRRSATQSNLLQILGMIQQYINQNNANPSTGAAGAVFTTLPNSITASTLYNYTINTCTTYTNCILAQATINPAGAQAGDTKCSCMQIDTNGNRYAFNSTTCTGTNTTSTCWTQ